MFPLFNTDFMHGAQKKVNINKYESFDSSMCKKGSLQVVTVL